MAEMNVKQTCLQEEISETAEALGLSYAEVIEALKDLTEKLQALCD